MDVASQDLQADRELVLEAVVNIAPQELQANREVVAGFPSQDLHADRDLVLEPMLGAVKQNGYTFKDAAAECKADERTTASRRRYRRLRLAEAPSIA